MLLPGQKTPDGIRCNTIVTRYPGGKARIVTAERAIFRIPGYEPSRDALPREKPIEAPWEASERIEREYAIAERRGIEADGGETAEEAGRRRDNLARAQRRARTNVRDLALSNRFKYFVTLTFDKSKVDRWNDREVWRVTKNWLDNHVRREGLSYVLVPERHKDGAIHYHGFFNDALPGVDSGHKTARGQVIYNLPAWPWGFTTAIEVYGEYGAAVGYVCKYITKGAEKVGGRWYYHGGKLSKPSKEYICADYAVLSENMDSTNIEALGCNVTVIETEV